MSMTTWCYFFLFFCCYYYSKEWEFRRQAMRLTAETSKMTIIIAVKQWTWRILVILHTFIRETSRLFLAEALRNDNTLQVARTAWYGVTGTYTVQPAKEARMHVLVEATLSVWLCQLFTTDDLLLVFRYRTIPSYWTVTIHRQNDQTSNER